MSASKHRHRSRRLAMQSLCCLDSQGEHVYDLAVEFIRESNEPLEVIHLAQQMLTGAWPFRQQADVMLAKLSLHWDVRRMPMVDRNILRLAIWELNTRSAPPKVIISEAVRLAKEFSTSESPRFINGILDALARQTTDDPNPSSMPPVEPDLS